MGTPGGIGGGLFAHYPARSDAIRASVDELFASSTRIQDLGAAVTERHGPAADAVSGSLEGPMSVAAQPIVRAAHRLSAAATLAGGSLNPFADAVDAYNAGVDELNRRYEVARAGDFFAEPVDAGPGEQLTAARRHAQYDTQVAEARSAIEHLLRFLESRLRDRLDQAADTTAALLDKGPSPATLRFLANAGGPGPATATLVSDDDETMWAPGDLTFTCDPSDPDSCDLFSNDGWELNWNGLTDTLEDAWDGAEWIWDRGGEEGWNFLAGDAIDACLDDPTSPDCGMEAIFMLGPLKLGKLVKFRKSIDDWLKKLRGTRRGEDAATTTIQGIDDLPPKVRAEVENAIERAAGGKERFPLHDGKIYQNRNGLLPSGLKYREWTAAPAGEKRGIHRVIIAGKNAAQPDAIYYWDHQNPPVRIGP